MVRKGLMCYLRHAIKVAARDEHDRDARHFASGGEGRLGDLSSLS